jgi:glycerophosphoryl diester phosphodiesterase
MMRLRITGTLLTLAAAVATAAEGPVVIAHRGGAALWPENTIAAFRQAIRLGVQVVEFDMNLTSDDRIVIHHDTTVNGDICKPDAGSGVIPGPIRGLTLAEIRRFECGSFARASSPRFRPAPGARIPALDDLLATVKNSTVLLLGETKMPADGGVPPERFVQLIDAAIRRHGVASRFILQSSDYRTAGAMRKRNASVRICLLNSRRHKPKYLEIARQHGATHLMLRAGDATPGQIRALKAAGLTLYSGTANSTAEWEKYVAAGFDGILTDDPAGLQEFLNSRRR